MVPMDGGPTVRRELDRSEVLQRVGSVSHGRVVFTQRALPAIRPVNHILDGDRIVICSHGSTALAEAARAGAVLAFDLPGGTAAGQAFVSALISKVMNTC